MNITKIVKPAVTLIASVGVGVVVSNVVKSSTPVDVNLLNKVLIGAGSFALTTVIADAATKSINAQIDEISSAVSTVKETVQVIQQETPETPNN